MGSEKGKETTPLTYLMSLMHSEIGRYRRRPDGSSYIILTAERHFMEFWDPESQLNRNRREPASYDLCIQMSQDQACSITVNIREENWQRPTVVMWPTRTEELPDELIVRKKWDESEIVLKVAELADTYWQQREMSDEELEQEPLFFGIPKRDRQALEEQLTAAGYEPPAERQAIKPAGRRPPRRTRRRSKVPSKPAKRKRTSKTKVGG